MLLDVGSEGEARVAKIKVTGTVVEMDGDELAGVIWRWIKELLILPYVDLPIDYHDLSLAARDRSADQVTLDAAAAVRKHNIGIKCATITPDSRRVRELGLKRQWRSPNGTIRAALGGTIFREPIVLPNVPRLVPGWTEPIVIGRHAFGDQYRATDFAFPGPGALRVSFTPVGGGEPIEHEVFQAPGSGVALAMYNLDDSIRDFARATLSMGLSRGYPVYLSTKNTVLTAYDGRFRELFAEVYEREFADRFAAAGIGYEHRLIDDMVASVLKWPGGYVWACKNYDGDVQADVVAQGFGSPGLMTSMLLAPDGRTILTEAAHGTVARHYRRYQAGEPAMANPIALIYAWTRGLAHRGRLDDNTELVDFANTLEDVVVRTVASGGMTADLAALVGPGTPSLDTRAFLASLAGFLG
jgi:isocitrate dehydrogenase